MNIKNVHGYVPPSRNNLFNKMVALGVTATFLVGSFFVFNTRNVFADETVGSDLSALTSEITVAQTAVLKAVVGDVPGDYAQSSVDALNGAITTAEAVTSDQAQSDVDSATSNLTAAVSAFTPIPLSDLTAYHAALAKIIKFNYTIESFGSYLSVLRSNVVTEENSQAEVDAATANIIAAQSSLVPIPTNTQTPSTSGGGGAGTIVSIGTTGGGGYMPAPKSVVIAGCNGTTGFSVTSGLSCAGNVGVSLSNGEVLGAQSFHFSLDLKKGATGDEVTQLQNFLNKAGYNIGKADGKFGAKTKEALIQFEKAHKIKADGIVGPKVRALLNA
jgi:hypothetical protein